MPMQTGDFMKTVAARSRFSYFDREVFMDSSNTTLRRNLILFLVGISFLGASGGIFDTVFNNFLRETYHLAADARGALEFPRELPGFLTALLVAALVFLSETRIAAVAAFATGVGMLGLAYSGSSWTNMIIVLSMWSIGVHLIMPVRSSIGMDLATGVTRGRRLGQISGVAVTASVLGYALAWALLHFAGHDYRLLFIVAGAGSFLAGIIFLFMRMPGAHLARPRLVWNNRYWLYYVLSFLFGARKQIFITFGPWVLIAIFGQPASRIAELMIVASLLGTMFQPMLGRMIDRVGERRVLMLDAVVIFFVCLGYGYAHLIGSRTAALWILYACFVLDQLMFGTGMARDTYLSKMVTRKEDLSPTLSMGVSINHVVSMSLPALGGWLWMQHATEGHDNHDKVFLGAAGIALIMLLFTSMIPRHLNKQSHANPGTQSC